LNAVVELRKNYIRMTGGRNARIGHNWEGVVTFFNNKYTDAQFLTQKHCTKMDERRITVHLLRPVGGRRHNAEIDRVWRITPSIFSQPITYCLEAKWGVVMKRHIDDFLNILKFSKEFGFDTEKGREIRAGIIPIFAGGTFNPNEKVYLEKETIDLTTWAHRMNVQRARGHVKTRRKSKKFYQKHSKNRRKPVSARARRCLSARARAPDPYIRHKEQMEYFDKRAYDFFRKLSRLFEGRAKTGLGWEKCPWEKVGFTDMVKCPTSARAAIEINNIAYIREKA
jgi:hypothetical protein